MTTAKDIKDVLRAQSRYFDTHFDDCECSRCINTLALSLAAMEHDLQNDPNCPCEECTEVREFLEKHA